MTVRSDVQHRATEPFRDRPLGFAEPDVVVLDPAVGTGTYLLAALEVGAEAAAPLPGPAARAERITTMARNMYGFELLVGPYAVAQLRLAERILAMKGELPEEGPRVLLTDTLESPHAAPQQFAHVPLFEKRLAEENRRARAVKENLDILVCLGNPPYFRHEAGEERGWIHEKLTDFLRDAPGVHRKNLYNLYVYFWRWALWKVFETGSRRGVVTFISASSYLRGPGFAGMRRQMRELFDELWIIDLGGEGRGARRSENVFAIQTPVAIAIGYREADSTTAEPATVSYTRIDGTREEKLAALAAISSFDDIAWEECFDDWLGPLLPRQHGDYFSWPALTDLFPWQHSGVQFKRTWPIAPSRELLVRRWDALLAASPGERRSLFRETDARRADRLIDGPAPGLMRYAFRAFDRQFALLDPRLADRPRPDLTRTHSARQLFLTSLSGLLGDGPAATITELVPDLHHFRGSFGGKDVIPLWRDSSCAIPNVTRGVLELLGAEPEDLFAYCYALLVAPSYTERYVAELEIPGPRVPLTRERRLFGDAVELGRRLVWLHTYGNRLVPDGHRAGRVPQGSATYERPIPQREEAYPERHSYDPEKRELHVGEGVFGNVSPEVRAYSVSGLDVIGSWLDYRMKAGAGRKSSALDEIRPTVWPEAFTDELLQLLWVLEQTVALGVQLDRLLDEIAAAPTYPASELPQPTEDERRPASSANSGRWLPRSSNRSSRPAAAGAGRGARGRPARAPRRRAPPPAPPQSFAQPAERARPPLQSAAGWPRAPRRRRRTRGQPTAATGRYASAFGSSPSASASEPFMTSWKWRSWMGLAHLVSSSTRTLRARDASASTIDQCPTSPASAMVRNSKPSSASASSPR